MVRRNGDSPLEMDKKNKNVTLIPVPSVKENLTLNDVYLLVKIAIYNQGEIIEEMSEKSSDNDRNIDIN